LPIQLAVVAGILYISSGADRIAALCTSDGTLLWRFLPSAPLTESSPLVVDGSVDALRASDGFLLWRAAVHVPSILPTIIVRGGMIYGVTQDGSVDALRASNGSALWRYKGEEGGAASITVAQGVVHLALQAGGIAALRASDGSILGRYTPQVPATQLPLLMAVEARLSG
jgi:outer membrane protein assembly factor BamB